jgi:hypothetical protein
MMVAAIACQPVGMQVAAACVLPTLAWISDPGVWRVLLALDAVLVVLFVLLRP